VVSLYSVTKMKLLTTMPSKRLLSLGGP
jgi:hypothetical protein